MRLPVSLRASLYATGALVSLTGVAWLVVNDSSRALSVACRELHGSAAMVFLVLLGAVAALHAPLGWRERRNRMSGALLSAALTVLLVTGIVLYYAGDERVRTLSSTVHWCLGLAAVVLLGAHVWLGRVSARAA